MIGKSMCTVWKDAFGNPNCRCNDSRVLRDAVGEEDVVVDVIQFKILIFYTTSKCTSRLCVFVMLIMTITVVICIM